MTGSRFLPIQNAINLRTLAGYQTVDGRIVKPNKLLRSGALSHLSQQDAKVLAHNYGLSVVIDLRMDNEIRREPDILPQDANYYQLPVLPFSDHANFSQRLKQRFAKPENPSVRMYRKMLTDSHAKAAYREMFDILLNNSDEEQAVLIHCSAGKDRTGVGLMLIEGALGLPKETIRADYLLSNDPKAGLKTSTSLDKRSTHHSQIESIGQQPATHENAHTVFTLIQNEYQSWQEYLTSQLGLTELDIEDLQHIYLTKR
ncbi:tyrosine-protein phosphatase [Lacticaseibacillus jixianensis]|uniref:Tyrosine-protein phosphatase n=1 Tax=Lacticaseibacillus jixianensis TaxID=2486012 RepID=A0ABW4BA50_9LACO|nr:tyrosine-protein phosphatase [Lacticaseibacillus jixianensis]